eukprot:CAMPEP_0170596260 /NCGR_PEP_ID=MMETSP0224-20130122/15014_1 /TAXON_ID=285029 /ORGANISM="Togula jolla, Strain CCCM 725" /LENGTH=439 /DNA_ID=CAMNT_0010920523 /DNA_START=55 /DNA_END=1370 /DNA_ORIENTATION=-
MRRSTALAAIGAVFACCVVGLSFVTVGQSGANARAGQMLSASSQQFLGVTPSAAPSSASSVGLSALAAVALGAVAVRALSSGAARKTETRATFVSVGSSAAPTFRDTLIACHAQASEAGAPSVAEVDGHIEELEAMAKKAMAGAASAACAMVFTGSMADPASAYPIFAQQNFKEPIEANGRIACANCHLQSRPIDVRLPHTVLPDTIFKIMIEVPSKWESRKQLLATGEKGDMNVGAIAILPDGFQLAPKDRLPKPTKKEMKGLAWVQYSKEKPNVVVAGPVPGARYEKMILPVLAPDPAANKNIHFDKLTVNFGGNRGRGQVYPEGNQSNVNQFNAKLEGKVVSIEGDATKTVTIQGADGSSVAQEVLPGATIVVNVGDTVKKDEPITTNPNVGGFGQEEKDIVLQDVDRVYAWCAFATSLFIAQLAFVLKKKQFEKV